MPCTSPGRLKDWPGDRPSPRHAPRRPTLAARGPSRPRRLRPETRVRAFGPLPGTASGRSGRVAPGHVGCPTGFGRAKRQVVELLRPHHRPIRQPRPLVTLTEEPYGYVGGNPVNRWGPTGMWPWDGQCVDLGALPGVGEDPGCSTRAERQGGTTKALVDLAQNDPGQLATIVAGSTCVVLTLDACAAATPVGWAVRSDERRREGDPNWVRHSALDGLVTYIFFALSAVPAAGAGGELGGSAGPEAYGIVAKQAAGSAGFLADLLIEIGC